MAVWIDPPTWPAHGRVFSHLVSDTSYAELHEVAVRAGIPRRAFDGDHYDVIAERFHDAVREGAQPTSGADLMRRLNASGLRLRKRKGDRGVARLLHQDTPWGRAHLDVVATNRPLTSRDAVALLHPNGSEWGVPVTASTSSATTSATMSGTAIATTFARELDLDIAHLVGYLRVTPSHTPNQKPRSIEVFAVSPPPANLPGWWQLFQNPDG